MLLNPQEMIDDFISEVLSLTGQEIEAKEIAHDCWEAPHQPKNLRVNYGAIYVFSLSSLISSEAPKNRVLKVGKVGPNSNNRFKYQHYKSGSASSTLAGAIENNPLLWNYIGFSGPASEAGEWIKKYTDRDNLYIRGERNNVISLLEVYMKGILGPVFEGSLSSKINNNNIFKTK